jgi:hypothetical protein
MPKIVFVLYIYIYIPIHTIGDSHSRFGWNNVIDHGLNAPLCYSFGRDNLNKIDIRNFNINDGDTIIFCLGEVDCRCHVHKYVTDKITYIDIIDNIVDKYFEAIQINIDTSKINLQNVCVYNVVPPVQKYNTVENPDFPYLGTDEDRKKYTLCFNEKLKKKCSEKKYIFFDIYDKYTDENGFLRKDLSDGLVHINNGIYITEFINKYLL